MTRNDGDGEPLDGSKHNYTLTFAAGQFPPVNAFWSVTMYDGKTQLLIENPINRYLINSPMLPQHEEERGRLADALHPERFARRGQGIELAARARTARSIWSCASTGRRRKPPSILPPGEGTWKPPAIAVAK